MTERPIIFSGPMVRAILTGAKTQTRRLVKGAPGDWAPMRPQVYSPTVVDRHGEEQPGPCAYGVGNEDGSDWIRCSYGRPGDRLWVREEWGCHWMYDDVPPRECRSKHPDDNYWYRADPPGTPGTHGCPFDGYMKKWRRAIHMPRGASRITLQVTGVRVERLQDISEADAQAEGVDAARYLGFGLDRAHARAYSELWESLHGSGSWDANPWVWVIEFERLVTMEATCP